MIKVLDNFRFKVSVSREGYQDKQTPKMCLSSLTAKHIGKDKMAFKEREVSIDEFIDYANHFDERKDKMKSRIVELLGERIKNLEKYA